MVGENSPHDESDKNGTENPGNCLVSMSIPNEIYTDICRVVANIHK